MPRLLILCEYPTLLGGERSMLATLPAIAAASFEVRVAAPPVGRLADTLRASGIVHVPWQTNDASDNRMPLQQLRSELARLLNGERPALVHANSLSTSRVSGPVVSQLGIPSVGHLRDIIGLSRQAVSDLNRHRQLVAVSEATRAFHVGQGVEAGKCVVSHNGIDLHAFRPRQPTGSLHRELGLPEKIPLATIIGQLGLRKGTDVALAAFQRIASAAPELHLLVIGERTSNKAEAREFEASLHAAAAAPPLAGRVHFLGNRADIATLLPECSLLVHAARQEPLGRVLIEAAASGLAVVATDVGGTREIFPEANLAVLVPPDAPTALANAIRDLLADDDRRRALGRAARQHAEQRFDILEAAARMIAVYESTLR